MVLSPKRDCGPKKGQGPRARTTIVVASERYREGCGLTLRSAYSVRPPNVDKTDSKFVRERFGVVHAALERVRTGTATVQYVRTVWILL